MQKFWRIVCVALASLALGVACGDNSGSGSGSGGGGGNNGGGSNNGGSTVTGPPVSLNQFPDEYAEKLCSRLFSCCNDEERAQMAENGFDFATEADCKTSFKTFFASQLQALTEAEQAGRVVYNADKAGNCIAWIEAQECSKGIFPDSDGQPSDCDEAFEGQVADGGECGSSEECREGYCDIEYDDEGNPVGMGTCAGAGKDGDECEWTRDCADGYYCNPDYESGDGFSGFCEPIGQEGDACDDDEACDGELVCNQQYDQETQEEVGTCETRGNIGDSCSHGTCVAEAFCELGWDDETGEQTNACVARKEIGETCDSSGQCVEGAYCDMAGDSTCQATKAVGESCESSQECGSGWCGSETNDPNDARTCQSNGGDGQMCTGD